MRKSNCVDRVSSRSGSPEFITRCLIGAAGLLVSAGLLAAPLTVDPKASKVAVTFSQMSVPVDAKFTRLSGQASFDPAAPESAVATIVIETASFDFGPGAEEYNAEVRKAEWFDTDKFPAATFEVNGVKEAGEQRFSANGKLTIKGITQTIAAPLTLAKNGAQWVFTGEVPIKRLDFGIGADEWKDTDIVANEVIIKFKIVAVQP